MVVIISNVSLKITWLIELTEIFLLLAVLGQWNRSVLLAYVTEWFFIVSFGGS
jgi:hypothetical protein